jgi:hypothetical protein
MIVEPIAADHPSANVGNPVSRLYYSRAQHLLSVLLRAFGDAPLEILPLLQRQLPRVDRKILFVNPAHRGVHQIGGPLVKLRNPA